MSPDRPELGLSVDPIIGWRVWSVLPFGPTALRSPVSELAVWPARAPMVACCNHRDHEVRGEGFMPANCSCGLYALREPPNRLSVGEETVVGQMALWGVVHEHGGGWRGQYGYPTMLYAPSALRDGLREAYGVPVLDILEAPTPSTLPSQRPPSKWVDYTQGRGAEWFRLQGHTVVFDPPGCLQRGVYGPTPNVWPSAIEYAWPETTVAAMTARVPRGHWQRAITVGVFELGGCQPNRWGQPQGACTKLRLQSLTDVLARLAVKGVKVKRTAGRYGGEYGATYRVVDVVDHPVAAPRPRVRP